MKSSTFRTWTLFIFTMAVSLTSCNEPADTHPVNVIFDTDMGPDYDDVGALAVLHALADNGEAEILATIASTKYEGVAAVLNVLNTYFNRPDLPIGVPREQAVTLRDWQHWTDTLIARYPHEINRNDEVPGAVSLYRRILADQPDNSVTIITVGFLTNISNLLQSAPDEFSDLSGKELVKRKVKSLVSMAGKFPSGTEFNIEKDAAAAKFAFENFEGPIIFSGFEIGQRIKTGLPLITDDSIRNSPVKDVFQISIPMAAEDSAGRMSWDQTAVLVGVRGTAPYYKLKEGTILVRKDGSNEWREDGYDHSYLVEDMTPPEAEELINELMKHQPEE